MHKFVKSLNRVLAIQSFGSSGSKFLHSLLDNHPNILVIPSLYMMHFFNFWSEDMEQNRESVTEEFLKQHEYWFDPKGYSPWGTDKMGPNRDESVYVERDIFNRNLAEVLDYKKKVSRKLFFQAIFVAYAISYNRSLNLDADQYVIVYPHHSCNPSEAVELTKDFPNTFFIHTWRELIQTMGSNYKISSTRWGGFWHFSCATSVIIFNFFLLDKWIANPTPYKNHGYSSILPEYKSRSQALRLEELHKQPEEKLKKLCQWIDIPWNDALLISSYNGKIWWNRPESSQLTGFNTKVISRTHDDVFNKFDRFRLNILLSKLKSNMGYSSVKWQPSQIGKIVFLSSLFLPLKMEIISIFPSKFSLPKTFSFTKNFPKIVQTIIRHRSLHKVGLGAVNNEIQNYCFNWILLTPVRSYLETRVILIQAMKQLSDNDFEVIKVL